MTHTTNPLHLIPARARATVLLIGMLISTVIPFILPDVPPVWQHVLQAISAIASLFTGAQSLSNLTPDRDVPVPDGSNPESEQRPDP